MIVLSGNFRGYDREHRLPEGAIVLDESTRENVNLSGRYLCKGPKCAPQLVGYRDRDVLWVDGSMEWTGEPLDGLFGLVPIGGVGMYRHRERTDLYREAIASIESGRYEGEPIAEQAAFYMENTTPEPLGLWETGIIVWRGAQGLLGPRWLAEQLAWTSQDQISLPRAASVTGTTITSLSPGTSWENPWFVWKGHK